MKMSREKNLKYNPFLIAFICFALISCLALCILFLSMIHKRDKDAEKQHYQEKAEAILNDLDIQITGLEEFAQKLVIDKKYMYSTVFQEKYNEYALLEDFKRYRNTSFLTKDMFLYYRDSGCLFRAEGEAVFKNVYFSGLSGEELALIDAILENPGNETEILSLADNIYILIPFKADYGLKAPKAVLGAVINHSTLQQRISLISGPIDGKLALYMDDSLLYCNDDAACAENAVTAVNTERGLSLCYIPGKSALYSLDDFLQLILILTVIFIIIMLAFLFADKLYQPLLKISRKYSGSMRLEDNSSFQNIYDEIEGIVDTALQNSLEAAVQLEQKQELYKQQLLRSLLNGTQVENAETYLSKLNLLLPGPFYYVISVGFSQETDEALSELLQNELKKSVSIQDREYLYTVAGNEKGQLWIICSIGEREYAEDLTEDIREIIDSYGYPVSIGIGNVYEGLQKLQSSWLESMDNLAGEKPVSQTEILEGSYENLQWLSNAFYSENEEVIRKELEKYVQWTHSHEQSYLMQLYTFSEFIGELARMSRANGITLSRQKLSLLLAAKKVDSFYEAACEALLEYHEKKAALLRAKMDNDEQRICSYIREHFMEYDLTVDQIADALNVANVDIRSAVRNVTGRKYTDYITFLRMEYAKELMAGQQLSVAEICEAVGYSSVSYFIRIFKEMTGTTPARYMKSEGRMRTT